MGAAAIVPVPGSIPPMPGANAPATVTATTASRVPVDALDVEHQEYAEMKAAWGLIDLLYAGGDRLRRNAASVLRKKPREIQELYQARCQAFTYQNVLGSGVDYYLSSIFERDPDMDVGTRQPDGTVQSIDLGGPVKQFYDSFRKNADRRQQPLVTVFRDVLRHVLLYRRSWLLIDLPKADTPPLNLGEQTREGLLDPYLVRYNVLNVVNWGETDIGDLDWIVIRTLRLERQLLQRARWVQRWYCFDRTSYRCYERQGEDLRKLPDYADLVAGPGPHALADLGIVPVVRIQVPKGLWLANRVLPQVLDHLNVDNAYSWALQQSNLAIPVISGQMNETPALVDGGYLKLPKECTLTWSEPPGNSYQRSEMRIAALREEIYRSMYLIAQGRSGSDMAAVQSGYSKQIEMTPAAHVQNYLGDTLREAIDRVMNLVAHVHGDALQWTVRGFDFTEDQTDVELARANEFASLQVQSPTAERENHKRAVRIRFKDASQTLQDQMCDEIDQSPTPQEKAQDQEKIQQKLLEEQFKGAQIENAQASQGNESATP